MISGTATRVTSARVTAHGGRHFGGNKSPNEMTEEQTGRSHLPLASDAILNRIKSRRGEVSLASRFPFHGRLPLSLSRARLFDLARVQTTENA